MLQVLGVLKVSYEVQIFVMQEGAIKLLQKLVFGYSYVPCIKFRCFIPKCLAHG